MSAHGESLLAQARDLLRPVADASARAELSRLGGYVALSVAAALAGSLAALALVPLVQDGAAPRLAGLDWAVRGAAAQIVLFVAAGAGFAALRWLAARQCARLVAARSVALRRQAHAGLIRAALPASAEAGSAEIANVLTYNTEILAQGYNALLQLMAVAATATLSLLLAFLVSPALALAAPAVLGFAALALRVSGREQARIGRDYVADMTRLFWHSEEFPRRLRHIRSFQREAVEQAGYEEISARLGDGYRRQHELLARGRLALEATAVAAIACALAIAGQWQGADRAALIAVGLLLGRLLPYLVSARQNLQQLRSAAPALALWRRHAQAAPAPSRPAVAAVAAQAPEPSAASDACSALRIERIGLAPPWPDVEARELILAPGRISLLLGASGAGKSSLLDALAGLAEPRAFHAQCGGRALDYAGYCARMRPCAYIAQGVRPWQHSVRECLAWADPQACEARMWQALEHVGLDARVRASGRGLDAALDRASNRFSGGELQRLLLAQTILRRPRLALLDETTAALDEAAEQAVLRALTSCLPHTALVVVSHRRQLAALAAHCLTLTPADAFAPADTASTR
ncbi:ATP-binding cassette domain-containing protein [Lysobacter enzymogenes]|uniref:ATP-binding cassette domain-containing protein n=1 Tax=Lysobacter enzymogenes TaxID=69 RepID=UPI0008960F71|nr:ATP-binding cassette domain-containing protein [Lysobacter enzymogenes]SDW99503.1 ATP-binding cassette, subfamily C [Lysobacter enzymogenes]